MANNEDILRVLEKFEERTFTEFGSVTNQFRSVHEKIDDLRADVVKELNPLKAHRARVEEWMRLHENHEKRVLGWWGLVIAVIAILLSAAVGVVV